MTAFLPFVLASFAFAAPSTAPHASSNALTDADAQIRSLIAASGAEVSVIYRPLVGTSSEIAIDADTVYHAASTMKVPVMIELFRQASTGKISLDADVPVTNTFHSIVDGSPFTLETSEAADGAAFRALGKTLSYRQLCEAMITISSNLATNVLIENLGIEYVQATVLKQKAVGMRVLRGVEDQKAFDKGMNNETTGRALVTLLAAIANGTAGTASACAEMQAILKRQQFNDGIPAGVPKGVAVGHKTGTITKIHHDAAIVYADKPYILVVMTRGFADEKTSDALIAKISAIVYGLAR